MSTNSEVGGVFKKTAFPILRIEMRQEVFALKINTSKLTLPLKAPSLRASMAAQ
ncbi:hypothetical protein J6590_011697 [Homalodisca vitripennis]|nr:hypothetical protein J6590_011697 [Homalodisca vitripennis]